MFFAIFEFFWKFIKTWVKNWVATPPWVRTPKDPNPKPLRSGHRRTQTPTNLGPDMDPSPNPLGSPPDRTPNPPGFGHAPIPNPLGSGHDPNPNNLGLGHGPSPLWSDNGPNPSPAPLGPSTDLSPQTFWVQTLTQTITTLGSPTDPIPLGPDVDPTCNPLGSPLDPTPMGPRPIQPPISLGSRPWIRPRTQPAIPYFEL
jgi:hypothetical protein